MHPDPIGESLEAIPCTFNEKANKCYGKGITDARKADGFNDKKSLSRSRL